jgi:hypothetical protein
VSGSFHRQIISEDSPLKIALSYPVSPPLFLAIRKSICERGITFVASGLPSFCGLPLAKRVGFA